MAVIQQKVYGELRCEGERTALWWREKDAVTGEDSAESLPLFLRYAFVERGTEAPFFPEVVLDDWGRELTGLSAYRWIDANGDLFPRAEIFGRTLDDRPRQRFLRELEIGFPLPCYVCRRREDPLTTARGLEAILLADAACLAPVQTIPPAHITVPLRRARVRWWRIPAGQLPEFSLAALLPF